MATTPGPPRNARRFTPERRQRYLDLLSSGVPCMAAARAVKIHYTTVVDHRRRDPEFAEAEEQARLGAVEAIEDALFQAAASGNVPAIKFFLTNRAPDRWRDTAAVSVSATAGAIADGSGGAASVAELRAAVLAELDAGHVEALGMLDPFVGAIEAQATEVA